MKVGDSKTQMMYTNRKNITFVSMKAQLHILLDANLKAKAQDYASKEGITLTKVISDLLTNKLKGI